MRHSARSWSVLCALLVLAGCGGKGLPGKTVDEKTTAAGQLGVHGADDNVPVLLAAAETEPEMVQLEAISALGRIGTPNAVAALGKIAASDSRMLRLAVAQALADVDPAAYSLAAPILVTMGENALPKGPGQDPDLDLRRALTTSLAIVRQKEGLDYLLARALGDPDEQIRNAAVKTLGRLKDTRPIDGLIQIYRTDNEKNRAWAIEALGSIGDPRVVPVLIEALGDYDKVTRGKAAWSLKEIQGKEAIPTLKQALAREENEMPAVVLCHALALLGEADAVQNLEHYILFARNEFARAEAGRALTEVGCCESFAAVNRAFHEDRDGLVKREAANAARKLVDKCPPDQVEKILGAYKR